MSCYAPLARWYDSLTGDVPYEAFADYDEALFRADGGEFHLLLDLCCGTGTLTWALAARGYEMIGCDRSVDMLMQAQGKAIEGAQAPRLPEHISVQTALPAWSQHASPPRPSATGDNPSRAVNRRQTRRATVHNERCRERHRETVPSARSAVPAGNRHGRPSSSRRVGTNCWLKPTRPCT